MSVENITYSSVFGYRTVNCRISVLTEYLADCIRDDRRCIIFALNPNKVMAAVKDKKTENTLKQADIMIPDGSGIIWASKVLKDPVTERITGIDLMKRICAAAESEKIPIFIYGASSENLSKAAENLKKEFPDLLISGMCDGYEHDINTVISKINESGAAVLFAALGSPRQEEFMADSAERMPALRIMLGVGGSVDVISGNVKRAPEWMQRHSLEWFYRLINKPRRILDNRLLSFIIYTLSTKRQMRRKQ